MAGEPKRRLKRGFLAIEDWLGGLDGRTIAGLCMLLMGLSAAMSPEFSAILALSHLGLAPRAMALWLAFSGGLILRWPRSRWYTMLIAPLAMYFAGTVYYYGAMAPHSSATPIVVVGFLLLYAVVAGVRDGRVG